MLYFLSSTIAFVRRRPARPPSIHARPCTPPTGLRPHACARQPIFQLHFLHNFPNFPTDPLQAPEKTYKATVNRKFMIDLDANGHYGDPKDGCASDEISVQITGITGDVCTPPCAGTTCPTDVPAGVTATPVCALKDPTGKQYCILECTPSENKADGTNDACGAATCKAIQGVGVCTYDDR